MMLRRLNQLKPRTFRLMCVGLNGEHLSLDAAILYYLSLCTPNAYTYYITRCQR
jgi:hypothetical protein